ncbi:MAG: hypothetical protein ACHBN1_04430 [Heteroscytonema crispum UTEX LB 1556]
MEETKSYFILWYRLDEKDSYLIWYGNDVDGIITNSAGKIPIFRDISSLLGYCAKVNLNLDDQEPTFYDLDKVKDWLKNPNKNEVDCIVFLNTWNLFIDVASSVRNLTFDPDHKKTNKIYDKLFWGNNLPSVTPPGKHYEPIWTDDEVKLMRSVLGDGLRMFRDYQTDNLE